MGSSPSRIRLKRSNAFKQWPRSVLAAATLFCVIGIGAILYWAQAVLIPLALASLLAFMLTPIVDRMERWGLPRVPSVVAVALFVSMCLGGIGWTVGGQLASLAQELPTYRENIKAKIGDVRSMFRGGALDRLKATYERINEELESSESAETNEEAIQGPQRESDPRETAGEKSPEEKPVPVRIESDNRFFPSTSSLASILGSLGTAALVFVLVLFMLIRREDLLNRLVSLTGVQGITTTTRALEEAKQRISRFLLTQFVLNASYGIMVGVSLWLIGLPYSLLWGLCAAVFRYVPYVGPWVAALLPIALSVTHFPGWTTAILVIGVFVVLELISNNILEPWLYGSSVGLSEVAVIVAAAFWTLMWGPIGLVLATPLTVCLVVVSKYVPALSVFDRLLSERPAMKPHIWLYQRLIARHGEDAYDIVENHVKEHTFLETCDELLVPTLQLAKSEWLADRIDESDEEAILGTLSDVLESLPPARDESEEVVEETPTSTAHSEAVVMGFPVRDPDDLVLQMIQRVLADRGYQFESLSSDRLIAERLAAISSRNPVCICVSALAPGDLIQAGQICKRLLAADPQLKVLVGRWNSEDEISERDRELLQSAGAATVVETLAELQEVVIPMMQFELQSRQRTPEDSTTHALST